MRKIPFIKTPRQTLLAVAALALLTVVGCGNRADVIGTWKLDRPATKQHFPESKLVSAQLSGLNFDIKFADSGDVQFDVTGSAQQAGKWKMSFGNVIITMSGKKYSLKLKDGLLIDNTKNKEQGAAFRKQ